MSEAEHQPHRAESLWYVKIKWIYGDEGFQRREVSIFRTDSCPFLGNDIGDDIMRDLTERLKQNASHHLGERVVSVV